MELIVGPASTELNLWISQPPKAPSPKEEPKEEPKDEPPAFAAGDRVRLHSLGPHISDYNGQEATVVYVSSGTEVVVKTLSGFRLSVSPRCLSPSKPSDRLFSSEPKFIDKGPQFGDTERKFTNEKVNVLSETKATLPVSAPAPAPAPAAPSAKVSERSLAVPEITPQTPQTPQTSQPAIRQLSFVRGPTGGLGLGFYKVVRFADESCLARVHPFVRSCMLERHASEVHTHNLRVARPRHATLSANLLTSSSPQPNGSGNPWVTDLNPNGAAAASRNVQSGDLILAVNGQQTTNLTAQQSKLPSQLFADVSMIASCYTHL